MYGVVTFGADTESKSSKDLYSPWSVLGWPVAVVICIVCGGGVDGLEWLVPSSVISCDSMLHD